MEIRFQNIPKEFHEDIKSIEEYFGFSITKLLIPDLVEWIRKQPDHIKYFRRDKPTDKAGL